jgi:hypothetical protein
LRRGDEALSHEEYFGRMDEIDKFLNDRLDAEVFTQVTVVP